MIRNRRLTGLLTILLGAALVGLRSNEARGQWGGFGGFNYVSQPTDFLNQQSMMNAAHATHGPVSNNVYAGNPNAYINRVRDNGFIPTYDVARRVPTSPRPTRTVSPGEQMLPRAPQPAANPGVRPLVPLPSFFDDVKRLVWPSDAPVAGELQQKRDLSDERCLLVLKELQGQGAATIASVTESRQRLLGYGRPALQVVRASTTPRVADGFHVFLMELYDSLAQAANPTGAPSASR